MPICTTRPLKHLIIPRLLAGLPLTAFGVMHLVSPDMDIRPILEAAEIPMVELNAMVAPIGEIVAGVLLLAGLGARVGALIGAGAMSVATYAHLTANWADEPPIALPIGILACCLYVLARGAGAWSVDGARCCRRKASDSPAA